MRARRACYWHNARRRCCARMPSCSPGRPNGRPVRCNGHANGREFRMAPLVGLAIADPSRCRPISMRIVELAGLAASESWSNGPARAARRARACPLLCGDREIAESAAAHDLRPSRRRPNWRRRVDAIRPLYDFPSWQGSEKPSALYHSGAPTSALPPTPGVPSNVFLPIESFPTKRRRAAG